MRMTLMHVQCVSSRKNEKSENEFKKQFVPTSGRDVPFRKMLSGWGGDGGDAMIDSLEKEEEENTNPLKMRDMVLLFSYHFKKSA